MTFNRQVLDECAPDVRLLTYGSEELNRLLSLAGVSDVQLDGDEFKVGGEIVRTVDELVAAIGGGTEPA